MIDEWNDREIRGGDVAVDELQVGIDGYVGCAARRHFGQAFENPIVTAAEEARGSGSYKLLAGHLHYRESCIVGAGYAAILVQGDHAVAGATQHRVIEILHAHHIVE